MSVTHAILPRRRALPSPMMFVSPPAGPKLEEPARPTPAASPAELGAPEEGPAPAPDDRAKLDMRRKSTSWKTFNLKRQFSKVDLKLKAAFAVPPAETDLDETAPEKGNSQFYCESSPKPEVAQEALPDPPPETPDEEAKPEIEEVEEETDRDKGEEKSPVSSPLRVCSDVFERMHKELQEKRSSDVYDRMHRELQERWQDKERAEAEAAPPAAPAERPDNLPLFEEDGRPTRPPRQKGRSRREEAGRPEPREHRLLSVPNAKSKPEAVRDLRRKQSQQAPPSFAGSFMRRFSKYRVTPRAHAHLTHTSTSPTPGLTYLRCVALRTLSAVT